MSKSLSCTVVFIAAFLFLICPTVCFSADETAPLNAEEVIGKLASSRGQGVRKEDTSGIVPSYRYVNVRSDYFRQIRGKEIKGEGVVTTVGPKSRVQILVKGSQPEKGYNVILITKQDASGLKQGDKISFHGRISNLRGEILEIAGEFSKGSE